MNIIKFKDIKLPGNEFFNVFLKGKYAYWIHMRYAVSLYHISQSSYILCEQDINNLLNSDIPYLDVKADSELYLQYIDTQATDATNSIKDLLVYNRYTADLDITIDELKKFRTWLAKNLLSFDQDADGEQIYNMFTDEETHVLEYYARGMYDDVVKYLGSFGAATNAVIDTATSTCGCAGSNLSSLYRFDVTSCDPLAIYRKGIYDKMCAMFSDINTWKDLAPEFLKEFKTYIDNIIRCNFTLSRNEYVSEFTDCGCDTTDNQSTMKAILARLSESLQYMIDKNLDGRKNYIHDALADWSKMLYESMEW